MIEKIMEEKRRRADKLHELLADPAVISNKSEYQSYAKELASLTPIINEYNVYLKLKYDLKDLEKVLGDKSHGHDKDFLILAEEERVKL